MKRVSHKRQRQFSMIVFLTIAFCAGLLVVSQLAAAKVIVDLRAGANNPKGDQTAAMVDMFCELVGKKTNGEVRIVNVYNSMGVEQVQLDAIKAGSLDIGIISNGNAGRFTDAFLPWDLPFMFKSPLKMMESLDGPYGKAAFAKFKKDTGIMVLTPITEGTGRDIQTKTKVRLPSDLKGLKIRAVSSPVDLAIWKAWGANPTPIDWGQTYAALQQGVVDGLGIVITAVLQNKTYEVVDYNLEIDYQMVFLLLMMNSKKFDSLKPEYQKAIREAAHEVHLWNLENTPKKVDAMRAELKKIGMEFYRPTAEEYQKWISIRDGVWKKGAEVSDGRLDLDLAKKISDSVK